jgi:leucyl-tRNA synthetase
MRHLHRTIVGVDADLQHLRFNTAIAKLIEFNNALTGLVNTTHVAPRELVEPLVQMLSPLCPHLADELWFRLGHDTTITYVPFPVADPALLVEDSIEVPVQVNGKVRARIQMSPTATEDEHLAAAMSLDAIISALDGRTPLKTIVVPGRTVNIVVK